MKKMTKKGFTLIELLAVIILLAIIGAFSIRIIVRRLNSGKVMTFYNSYNDVYKQVSEAGVLGTISSCDDTDSTMDNCSDNYDYNTSKYLMGIKVDGSKVYVKFISQGNLVGFNTSACKKATNADTCYDKKDSGGSWTTGSTAGPMIKGVFDAYN